MHRLYENDEIVVFWNSEKCVHAAECVKGSPETFNFSRKPWVQLGNVENSEVWQTIEKCPSGALGILYRHGIDTPLQPENCRSIALDGDKKIGECDYTETESAICIYHTDVDPEYGGKGIAKRLVYKALEYAEKNGKQVSATCSYAINILDE